MKKLIIGWVITIVLLIVVIISSVVLSASTREISNSVVLSQLSSSNAPLATIPVWTKLGGIVTFIATALSVIPAALATYKFVKENV